MRRLNLGWAGLCCLLTTSCVTLQPNPDLDVSLVSVRLGESTAWETTAYFKIRLANASPEPIALSGSAHRFHLNGRFIGQGLSDAQVEVPRLSSVIVEFPVHLRNVAVASRIRPILASQAVEYRVQSTLYFSEGRRGRRCHLARDGRLALADLQMPGGGEASGSIP